MGSFNKGRMHSLNKDKSQERTLFSRGLPRKESLPKFNRKSTPNRTPDRTLNRTPPRNASKSPGGTRDL